MNLRFHYLIFIFLVIPDYSYSQDSTLSKVWIPDNNGSAYKNSIIFVDYSKSKVKEKFMVRPGKCGLDQI